MTLHAVSNLAGVIRCIGVLEIGRLIGAAELGANEIYENIQIDFCSIRTEDMRIVDDRGLAVPCKLLS